MKLANDFVLTFLVNALWQTCLLWLAAMLCVGLMQGLRAGAAYQHCVWAAALALCLVLPVLSASFPALSTGNPLSVLPFLQGDMLANDVTKTTGEADWLIKFFAQGEPYVAPAPSLISILLFGYGLFIVRQIIGFTRKLHRTHSIMHRAQRFEHSPQLASTIEECSTRLKVENFRVVFSNDAMLPVTFGVRRAVIVLPRSWINDANCEVQTAAVAHELAHIARRDYPLNLLYELLALPLAFHPAIKIIRRRIAETREMACDELATKRLIEPFAYAHALVRLAHTAFTFNRPTFTLGIHDTQAADVLEKRIMNITDTTKRAGARLTFALILASTFALTSISIAATRFSLSTNQTVSADNFIVGAWKLYITDDKGKDGQPKDTRASIIVDETNGVLSGKANVGEDGRPILFELIEPAFDGTRFTFKVNNGEEFLEGTLTRSSENELQGTWRSSKTNHSGVLKMRRVV